MVRNNEPLFITHKEAKNLVRAGTGTGTRATNEMPARTRTGTGRRLVADYHNNYNNNPLGTFRNGNNVRPPPLVNRTTKPHFNASFPSHKKLTNNPIKG